MFHVVLDPGHARGSDKHGCNGFSEQAHNLLMVKSLKSMLESTGAIVVVLTRDNEISDPALTSRGKLAKGADLFCSMHTNGAHGTARGVTVFHSIDLPTDKMTAQRLAEEIAHNLGIPVRGAATRVSEKYFSKADPSTNEDYLTVIDSAQDIGCTHVFLSESGFHDNLQDWAAMHTPQGIEAITEAHAKVFCGLLGVQWPAGVSAPVAQPSTQPAPTTPVSTDMVIYIVKRGDTPGAIARRYGVDVNDLMALNGVTDPRALQIGVKLRIPGTGSTLYKVQPGDTLSRLEGRFGVPWEKIAALNGISDPKALRAGATITIPKV